MMSMMENTATRKKVVLSCKTSICILRVMSTYLMLAKADTPVGVTALGPISNLGKEGKYPLPAPSALLYVKSSPPPILLAASLARNVTRMDDSNRDVRV